MDKVNEDHFLSLVISTVLTYLHFWLGELGADSVSRALASYSHERCVRELYKFLVIQASSSYSTWLRQPLKAGALLNLRTRGRDGGGQLSE